MPVSYEDLPHNIEAEQAVIGACMLSDNARADVAEILKPDDFYDINNKIAYEILFDMYNTNKPVDIVTFSTEAQRRGVFDRLGGQPFLAEIMSDFTPTLHASFHAEIVKNCAIRRNFYYAGEQITALAFNDKIEASDIVGEAEKIILESSLEKNASTVANLNDLTSSALEQIQNIRAGLMRKTGYKTNFTDLDKIVSFQPGSLNIIAARPSMGKTALALNIAQFGGDKSANNPVLFFSLEMSAEQLINRMLAAESCVSLSQLVGDENLFDIDFESVRAAAESLQKRNNIFINDTSELNAVDFRAKCRRFKAKHQDLALVVVDYLQLMNSGKKNNENRNYEVSEISRIMKSVAVELNCPIIALSQLSRETEKRAEKKPQLSDLRDSGAIEQDADTVILLYREDYYANDSGKKEKLYESQYSKVDLRVAKNRNGKTGSCSLTFMRDCTKFANYAED